MLKKLRKTRKNRIRAKVSGTSDVPRFSVHRSSKYNYAQLIDDEARVTLVSASHKNPEIVGKSIAEAAAKKKITKAVFDRSGYKYHGRVKLIAEAARVSGLKF